MQAARQNDFVHAHILCVCVCVHVQIFLGCDLRLHIGKVGHLNFYDKIITIPCLF